MEITEGACSSLTDALLVFIQYGLAFVENPSDMRSLHSAMRMMERKMFLINYDTLKSAVQNMRRKGWIKEMLHITPEGHRRLEDILPSVYVLPKWDGKWYFVIFDIPEKIKTKREILRAYLKIFKFGKLQNSVWISPINFLGDVDKIVKEQDINPYVIFSISHQVGTEDGRVLTEKVWGVRKLNEEYNKFVEEVSSGGSSVMVSTIFKYQRLLREDPQLPRELLPEDWAGEEAFQIYLRFMMRHKK